MSEQSFGRGALAAGGLAAILASAYCLGSLVLVALGFSAAWIGNLTALEPYRPVFIGGALVALFLAYRGIYRPVAACEPGEACAAPQARSAYKMSFWGLAALVIAGRLARPAAFRIEISSRQIPAATIGFGFQRRKKLPVSNNTSVPARRPAAGSCTPSQNNSSPDFASENIAPVPSWIARKPRGKFSSGWRPSSVAQSTIALGCFRLKKRRHHERPAIRPDSN